MANRSYGVFPWRWWLHPLRSAGLLFMAWLFYRISPEFRAAVDAQVEADFAELEAMRAAFKGK